MKPVTAGIDIGGIDTEIGLGDSNGKIYQKEILVTKEFSTPDDFIRACADTVRKLGKSNDLAVKAIGVAAPNGNAYKGTIENPVNLPWKGIIPFAKNMHELTGVPTALTNDANAAAIGEKVFGGARDMNNFIVITLGAGLGSGIYCNGEILNGHLGIAGEMGH
ncbi:MAG TPA: ROK family protein, partial [Ohtaekwangia sp.]|nr:ROK family protein [Ohtaekwangia sp.]